MNKQQTARLQRARKVATVLSSHPADVATVPAFADVAQEFENRLALASALPGRVKSGGATERKDQRRTELETRLLKASNALYLLLRKEDNLEAARTMPRKIGEYQRLDALALRRLADSISQTATRRAADLAPYNLDAAAVQALATATQAYDQSIAQPKTAIEAGKVLTTTTAQVLRELDTYLKDDFYSALQLLPDTHPHLYALLREAMRLDDPGVRKRKGKPGPQA